MKEDDQDDIDNQFLFELYSRDTENKVCADCKVPKPTFSSVNHGILICSNCAEKHKKLGFNISYIRDTKAKWDNFLKSFLELGGNFNFSIFCRDKKLEKMEIEVKYKTKIMQFYRKVVRFFLFYF